MSETGFYTMSLVKPNRQNKISDVYVKFRD